MPTSTESMKGKSHKNVINDDVIECGCEGGYDVKRN